MRINRRKIGCIFLSLIILTILFTDIRMKTLYYLWRASYFKDYNITNNKYEEIIYGIANLGHPSIPILLKTANSKNPAVRRTALIGIATNFDLRHQEEIFLLVEKSLRDSDPEVVRAALDCALQMGERAIIPSVIELLDNERTEVRVAANETLRELVGYFYKKFRFNPYLPREERFKKIKEIRKEWETTGFFYKTIFDNEYYLRRIHN